MLPHAGAGKWTTRPPKGGPQSCIRSHRVKPVALSICGSLHCVAGTAVVSRAARPQGPPGTTGAQDVIARKCSTKGASTGRRRVVRWRNVNQAPISQRTGTRAARAYSPIRIPQQRFDGREPRRIEHRQWVQDHRGGARHMVGSTALGSAYHRI